MAPEQILGSEVDGRADLYGVGVILYEMLSGQRPFRAKNLLELLDHAAEGKVESLCDTRPELALPRRVDRLVLGCLQREPDGRPESAAALAQALRELTPSIARQQQDQERALMELVGIRRRWTRRLRWVLPATLVLLVLAASLAWSLSRVNRPEGVALAPGERLFVSASSSRVPDWVDSGRPDGVRGEVGNVANRDRAVRLAQAEVLARLADVPSRFDPGREPRRYRADLGQVYQQGRELADRTGRWFLDGVETFWVKLAVGVAGGKTAHRYDAHAFCPKLAEPLQRALRRLFAELRYDRYSFLTDEAVRQKRCDEAQRLAGGIEQAIADLAAKPARRERLRFILQLRLRPCTKQ